MSDCCHPEISPNAPWYKTVDWLFWSTMTMVGIALIAYLGFHDWIRQFDRAYHFTHGVAELMGKMWWGLALGILFVGILSKVPRDIVTGILGPANGMQGLIRATLAGLTLDLCSHGILLVATKLYERGVSIAQVIAFLIASPWNSLSLTIILVSLIGLKWTLAFVVLSAAIALSTGWMFARLVQSGHLPQNPNTTDLPDDFKLWPTIKSAVGGINWHPKLFIDMVKNGAGESRMILRWIFLGVILAAGMRAFMDPEQFGTFFGPTMVGLLITLVVATVIEVCSEGSAPIAADILTRAGAPGNSFLFLMTGAATDYTEILAIREATQSWKIALFIPLLTTPQVLLIAYLINQFAV